MLIKSAGSAEVHAVCSISVYIPKFYFLYEFPGGVEVRDFSRISALAQISNLCVLIVKLACYQMKESLRGGFSQA